MADTHQSHDLEGIDRLPAPDPRPRGPAVAERHELGVRLFLIAAAGSFLLSIALWFTDNRQEGLFVGLWVPSILAAGAFWLTAVART